MSKTNMRRAGVLVAGLALVAAACGGDDDEGSDTTSAGGGATTAVAPDTTGVADTTAGNATTTAGTGTTTAGAGTPDEAGALEGLKGTTPLVELSSDFTDRLLEIDPALTARGELRTSMRRR